MKHLETYYEMWNPFKKNVIKMADKYKIAELLNKTKPYNSLFFSFPYVKEIMIYWRIPLQGIDFALEEINMEEDLILMITNNLSNEYPNLKDYIFICKQNDEWNSFHWFCLPDTKEIKNELKRRKGKYMGEIKLEPSKLEEWKMKKEAEKYNL